MKNLFLSIIFILVSSVSQCQIRIEGTVCDIDNNKLPGINVMAFHNKKDLISYGITDNNGYFCLTYNIDTDSIRVTAYGFDYEKKIIDIGSFSRFISIKLKEMPIMLKEVHVKAPAIEQQGDTLSYLVSSFSSKDDIVIGDVLKKMPGIDMDESGRITYQGKEINKFYIENMDMLQGRYNIATKNISSDDVALVEVYENHQPVKMLKDIQESDNAAINLKLKPDAKGVLNILAQIGLGAAPLLWNTELTSLYFSKKCQNINTYKSNNSGDDVTNEFTSFYSDAQSDNTGDMLSVHSPASPQISRRRYLFNNTNSVSSNFLRAVSEDVNFSANVMYYNDYLTKESLSTSTYYLLEDSLLTIKEKNSFSQSANNADATFKIETNKENIYFTNSLNLKAQWKTDNGRTVMSDTSRQELNDKAFNITDKFDLKKNINGKILSFTSINSYNYTPQEMTVKSNLYKNIFVADTNTDELKQSTAFNGFKTYNKLFVCYEAGYFTPSWSTGANIDIQSLESSLKTVDVQSFSNDSLNNNLMWNNCKAFISTGCGYKRKKLKIDLYIPLEFNILIINDKIPKKEETVKRFTLNPGLDMVYDASSRWTVKASYSHRNYLGGMKDIYTGYILSSYNILNRYDGQLAEKSTDNYYLRFAYRDVMKSFFGNIDIFYERYNSNLLLDRSFIGILQVQEMVGHNTLTDSYGLTGEFSKHFNKIRTTVKLKPSYFRTYSSIIQQGDLVDYNYEFIGIKCGVETQLYSCVEVSYDVRWNTGHTITETESYPNINTLSNFLKIKVFPIERMTVTAGFEQYLTKSTSTSADMLFADLYVKYRFSKIDIFLSWCNIFNNTEFKTISYSEINRFMYSYEIRPSEVLVTVKFKIL